MGSWFGLFTASVYSGVGSTSRCLEERYFGRAPASDSAKIIVVVVDGCGDICASTSWLTSVVDTARCQVFSTCVACRAMRIFQVQTQSSSAGTDGDF